MKNGTVIHVLLLLCLGWWPLATGAQEENRADHDALRALRLVAEDALSNNELDKLKPHLAPDFAIVTFTDREFRDFPAFKAQWQITRREMLGERGSYKVDLNPEHSVILGDLALCRGNARNTLVDAHGKAFQFTSHWSAVCQKTDGKWLILRGHNSLDPFRNPMLVHGVRTLLFKAVTLTVIIAIGAALVVWRFRRRLCVD